MKKITGAVVGLVFLLCAFSAQAAQEVDVSIPSVGEACSNDLECTDGELCINDICSTVTPCSNDLDCADGELCIDDICSAVTPCSNDLDCGSDESCVDDICIPSAGVTCSSSLDCAAGEVCIDAICVQGECGSDADCDEGLICSPDFTCVECINILDCASGEYCSEYNTCEIVDDCELIIKPPRININKKSNPPWVREKLKVKGNENFDPFGVISVDDPLYVWDNTIRRKRDKLKFIIEVTTDPMPDEGFYPIRVGNCIGEVELYDKKAAE